MGFEIFHSNSDHYDGMFELHESCFDGNELMHKSLFLEEIETVIKLNNISAANNPNKPPATQKRIFNPNIRLAICAVVWYIRLVISKVISSFDWLSIK